MIATDMGIPITEQIQPVSAPTVLARLTAAYDRFIAVASEDRRTLLIAERDAHVARWPERQSDAD